MEFALLGTRLLLAVVFATAATTKLRDGAGFRTSLVAFGVPAALGSVLGIAVPLAEFLTAVLLLPGELAPAGAAAAVSLLTVFTLAVLVNLAGGRAPECRCFGRAEAAPIGPATLVRNAALLAGALAVLGLGPGAGVSAVSGWGASSPGVVLVDLLTLAAVPTLGALGRLAGSLHARNRVFARRIATLERQLADSEARGIVSPEAGLAVGDPAPSFDLPLLAGHRATLATLTHGGRPALLVFSSALCPSCAELWPDIGRWQAQLGSRVAVTVVGMGSAMAIEMKLMGSGVRDAVLAEGTDLDQQYRIAGIPSAVVVSPAGAIDSETVLGPLAVRDLVRRRFEA
jgi:uncharacterized membrane protein YphA (DoxX/SURF4 family)